MKKQDYNNHERYYAAHHFVFYPVALLLVVASLYMAYSEPHNVWIWIMMSIGITFTALLSFMMRQHYALGNQNRIVRLEMRLRYYVLTQQRLEPLEQQLTFSQLAALRFASDEELPALIQKAISEKMSPDSIKKSILNWTPDHMRV